MDVIQNSSKLILIFFYLLSLLSFSAFPASAEIFHWVDGEGKLYFSDRPDDKYKSVLIRPRLETLESQEQTGVKQRELNRRWFDKQSKRRLTPQPVRDKKRQRWLHRQAKARSDCRKARDRWRITKAQHKQQRRQGITVANDKAYKQKLEILELKIKMACD